MNTKQYQAIQYQLDNEKNELLQEISIFLQKKQTSEKKLEYEIHVFRSRQKPLLTSTSAVAGMLIGDDLSMERMNQLKVEIKKLNEFIQMNEMKLERLKEKESTIESLYQDTQRKKQKELEKKEEKDLLDMKITLGL